jgi:putative spermidine/putrescine transport system substrate-binding protein
VRKSLNVVAVGALLVLAAACGGGSGKTAAATASAGSGSSAVKDKQLVITSWGGVWTDNEKRLFFDPFEKDTGIKVQVVVNGSSPMAPALLQAQQGRVAIDISETENAYILKNKGYLQQFPQELMDVFKGAFRSNAYNDYVVNLGQTATLLVCNPAVMKKCPQTPAEFFDVKNFPGPRAINNTNYSSMAFALLADGVPADKLIPLDIPRAMKKLQSIKSSIAVWPSSGSQQQQVLIDKEVGAAYMWNGRAFVVKSKNIPNLQLIWNGSQTTNGDGYAILKDAPHKQAAYEFFRWLAAHPEAQAEWTKALTYPTPTNQLDSLIPAEISAALPVAAHATILDSQWLAQHQGEMQKAWQGFLGG